MQFLQKKRLVEAEARLSVHALIHLLVSCSFIHNNSAVYTDKLMFQGKLRIFSFWWLENQDFKTRITVNQKLRVKLWAITLQIICLELVNKKR